MTKTKPITDDKAKQFRDTWTRLCDARSQLDYDLAKLAVEIRDEFPAGPSGDAQFRAWCGITLEVGSARTRMFLDVIRAYRVFDDVKAWQRVGGWRTITFLMNLPAAQRRRVLVKVQERAIELNRNLSYDQVKRITWSLGILPPANANGRPNQTEAERKLTVLRLYLREVIAKHKDLKPPKDVVAALQFSEREKHLVIAAERAARRVAA